MSSSISALAKPRVFPTSGCDIIDASDRVEEETLPTYAPDKYYPIHIGDLLDALYQVLVNLGYGVTSTVWLCRDLVDPKYVALKVYVHGIERDHELRIYNHINSVRADCPHGRHICLVLEPLGLSVDQFLWFFPEGVMTLDDLKPCLRQVLGVLDFLHTEANVIHTDIQLKNLLLHAGDPQTFSNIEEGEIKAPSPRKMLPWNGLPLLSDFGEARFGNVEHHDDIMPNVYRACEVVLKMNWDCKVYIWSVATMAWDIVCRRTLVHLAEMVALLGIPPAEFGKRSRVGHVFFDNDGRWKDLAPVPDITLDRLAAHIQGDDKDGFLLFLRRALEWDPERRPTARDLLFDAWLMKGLDLSRRG
ncbi:kinase-like protein [Aspergillus pseudonomiae]|uniref:non-specific serine/threonine protein kinase n=1 Tax=Aspergillus pseudonomiae TaxID=1506151 RepID=A0A5N7DJA3_9EURO|nr:kinase-like protein [Aspergillus pseudonomiae]KAE8406209.1 kinase-like protein [Aspergillus pseudonomiae]